MREVVWVVNPRCDNIPSVASVLEQLASQFLDAAGIRVRLEFPEDISPLPLGGAARHQLALGVREALTNVVRHAGASEVVLMDIHLPGRSGIECVARLRPLLPQTQIIMLTVEEKTELIFESLKAGATGYLVKHVPAEEILEAIAQVHHRGAPMSSHIYEKLHVRSRAEAVARFVRSSSHESLR
jgi:DNA-binding NarL/FixJ family response regulator